jgi:hypothetical protein
MVSIRWSLALLLGLSTACGSDDQSASGGACADTSKVAAFPTPRWQTGPMLSPPSGDYAVGLLTDLKPKWADALSRVDGWPARPTIVLPLSASASSVDASRVSLFAADSAGALTKRDVVFEAKLSDEGTSLVVQPRDPFPPDARDVVLVVASDAIDGAKPLPACSGGKPDPAYATARASLPEGTDAALALPFHIATTAFDLGHLYERIAPSPVLKVASVEARALASFGDAAPPSDVAALLAPTAASGILELPAYAGADGVFELDTDGAPKAQGTTKPGFIVALPATGSAPYPFVLFQHGGGQDKSDFFQLAGPLAQAGFAFVAIDLPLHGDRAGVGGGTDVDFSDIAKTRDNFRQAVSDHMAVFTGIAALNAALAPVLGVSEPLDAKKGFYMGLSLGGISGSITFSTTPNVNAAGLFVAAGGYPEIVSKGLFAALVSTILKLPTPDRETVLGMAETILDGADPLSYAIRVEDRSLRPRPALFMQAIEDPVIPEPSSDQWARAFGATLAEPFDHAVDAMQTTKLPTSDGFAFPGGSEKATRVLYQNPMSEIPASARHGALIVQPYSQEAVAHCFSTFLANGSCEAIDTGFATH